MNAPNPHSLCSTYTKNGDLDDTRMLWNENLAVVSLGNIEKPDHACMQAAVERCSAHNSSGLTVPTQLWLRESVVLYNLNPDLFIHTSV